MPCYSSIKTQLTDPRLLKLASEALRLSIDIGEDGRRAVVGGSMFLARGRDNTYVATGDTGKLQALSRKYAEIGVREWARKQQFSVASTGERSFILTRR